ncbi:MAG: GcrA cell cycle regulator [Caulobacter sp.]|nr:GcrA cell cycle regulator [Caulobacter sp.]
MDWNEERTATLRKLWLEGLSASQVARQLGGVSRSAVIGKIHRLGITVRETPVRPRTTARAIVRTPRARVVRDAVPAAPRQSIRVVELVELEPTANILGLSTHSCRWPIGNPDSMDFGFCGREKMSPRGSYCEDHARGAFRKLQSPADMKAWSRRPNAIELHTA